MNKYLSIVILKVNGLYAPIKRHRGAEWIRKHDLHICSPLETQFRNKRPTQTEGEGLEKNIPSKWTGKKRQGSNTYIRQNIFQNKAPKTRQRRSFHNSKGKNLSGSYKHCKHRCTQHRSTKIYKDNLGGLQEKYRQQNTYRRAF